MKSSNRNVVMPSFCSSLYDEMEEKREAIERSQASPLQTSEQCVTAMMGVIDRLQQLVISHLFTSTTEEIYFFKEVKPLFYSRLIYYLSVFRIELRKPPGSEQSLAKYIYSEFHKLEQFYAAHRPFYEYYRSGSTYLGEAYLLRGRKLSKPLLIPTCLTRTRSSRVMIIPCSA